MIVTTGPFGCTVVGATVVTTVAGADVDVGGTAGVWAIVVGAAVGIVPTAVVVAATTVVVGAVVVGRVVVGRVVVGGVVVLVSATCGAVVAVDSDVWSRAAPSDPGSPDMAMTAKTATTTAAKASSIQIGKPSTVRCHHPGGRGPFRATGGCSGACSLGRASIGDPVSGASASGASFDDVSSAVSGHILGYCGPESQTEPPSVMAEKVTPPSPAIADAIFRNESSFDCRHG
jgi:hypothetical protein